MAIRIVIADDHGVLRAGLRALLSAEPDLQVVGEAADGVEALRKAMQLYPDVLLLDISMPGLNGIEVAQEVHRLMHGVRILMLTMHEDRGIVEETLRVGAAGYIVKRALEAELIGAIHAVARGERYIFGELDADEPLRPSARPAPAVAALAPLSEQEAQVLRLLAEGYTTRQIATKLTIDTSAVENHRDSLSRKLGLASRVELVLFAREHGLLVGA